MNRRKALGLVAGLPLVAGQASAGPRDRTPGGNLIGAWLYPPGAPNMAGGIPTALGAIFYVESVPRDGIGFRWRAWGETTPTPAEKVLALHVGHTGAVVVFNPIVPAGMSRQWVLEADVWRTSPTGYMAHWAFHGVWRMSGWKAEEGMVEWEPATHRLGFYVLAQAPEPGDITLMGHSLEWIR